LSARQKTISKEVTLQGPGLFTGEPATLTFAPAVAGSGINFVREQDGKSATIPAIVQNVLKRPRRTCLRNGTLFVQTIEHCMAALSGMGVDNAIVKVAGGTAGEVPAGDGSSRPFVELIKSAGMCEQEIDLEPLVINQAGAGPRTATAMLAALSGLTGFSRDYLHLRSARPHCRQTFNLSASAMTISIGSLAPARARSCSSTRGAGDAETAGWEAPDDQDTARDSPPPAPVQTMPLPLRRRKCVRHKVLDLIGDLYLSATPSRGRPRPAQQEAATNLNHQPISPPAG
jgi:hypothetical protein